MSLQAIRSSWRSRSARIPRYLIVDDNVPVRRRLADGLHALRRGATCVEVESGADAVAACEREAFAAV